MPGRNYTLKEYRYGYNGKENDKEFSGGTQDYGFRVNDTRLGRFFSVDPIKYYYPEFSPYHFAGNTPIASVDLEGLEPESMIKNNKITRPLAALLVAAFNYEESSVMASDWVPYKKVNAANSSAMTLYSTVMYKENLYPDQDLISWFQLISHEQEHRNQIDKTGGMFWYFGYGLNYLSNKGKLWSHELYKNNHYEQTAYKIGFGDNQGVNEAKTLWNKYGLAIKNVLEDKSMPEYLKEGKLKEIGLRHKYDMLYAAYDAYSKEWGGYKARDFYHGRLSDLSKQIEYQKMTNQFLESMRNTPFVKPPVTTPKPEPGCGVRNLCCFIGGTKISLPNGKSKLIEKVQAGDTVLTYDFKQKQLVKTTVSKSVEIRHLNFVKIESASGKVNINTDEHSYFVKGKGWCSTNPKKTHEIFAINAAKLEIDDIIITIDSLGNIVEDRVFSIENHIKSELSYNIFINNSNHCYFANGILVYDETLIIDP